MSAWKYARKTYDDNLAGNNRLSCSRRIGGHYEQPTTSSLQRL
jgi:hypothetical protein